MRYILSFCTFPTFCISLYSSKKGLKTFFLETLKENVYDVILPFYVEKILTSWNLDPGDIDVWCTFSGPAPFTTCRVNLAFLYGICGKAQGVTPDFFDVFLPVLQKDKLFPKLLVVKISQTLFFAQKIYKDKKSSVKAITEDQIEIYRQKGFKLEMITQGNFLITDKEIIVPSEYLITYVVKKKKENHQLESENHQESLRLQNFCNPFIDK